MHTVIGRFNHLENAKHAIQSLYKQGFSRDDIGILSRGHLIKELNEATATPVKWDRVAYGAVIGGLAGFLIGLLLRYLPITASPATDDPIVILSLVALGLSFGLLSTLMFAETTPKSIEASMSPKGNGIMLVVEVSGRQAAKVWHTLNSARQRILPSEAEKTEIANPIVGLFADHAKAEKALKKLLEMGVEHEQVDVLDMTDFNTHQFVDTAPALFRLDEFVSDTALHIVDPQASLEGLGVSAEMAPFYARALEDGSVVMIIRASASQAPAVWLILEEMGASQLN